MEKIGICTSNGKPIIGRCEYEEAVLKVNEIIEEMKHLWVNLIDLQKEALKTKDWIKEHEKYVQPLEKAWKEAIEQTLKKAMEKKQEQKPKATIAGKPPVSRYELSDDGVGLIAYLAPGRFCHIQSHRLSPEQVSIREQLLEMKGK